MRIALMLFTMMWLIGCEFQIGKARLRGQYYCDPCLRPSSLSGKTEKFLEVSAIAAALWRRSSKAAR
jgi:hypothetical protein